MNYIILKNIIEATVQNFRCKECSSSVGENNINILGIAGSGINLEVICPECKAQGIVKAEIGFMNQPATPDMLANLKNSLLNINQAQVTPAAATDGLKDSDILSIRENLKKCISIEDMFKS